MFILGGTTPVTQAAVGARPAGLVISENEKGREAPFGESACEEHRLL
jgi:hypothetical protein